MTVRLFSRIVYLHPLSLIVSVAKKIQEIFSNQIFILNS